MSYEGKWEISRAVETVGAAGKLPKSKLHASMARQIRDVSRFKEKFSPLFLFI